MRHLLPWNVNGIPSTARDAARAAASKEGLSVGDWLTRRILSETQGEKEPSEPCPAPAAPAQVSSPTPSSPTPAPGEPQIGFVVRKIDDAIRLMARRLDAAELAQVQTDRGIGNAAAEITAATRDQAEAFTHLTRRIEEVEQHTNADTLRTSVRSLHQALTQLATHVARTTAETKGQTEQLAEQMARQAAEATARAADIAERIDHLPDGSETAFVREQINKLSQFMEERFGSLSERVQQTESEFSSIRSLEDKIQSLQDHIGEGLSQGASLGPLEERILLVEQKLDGEREDRAELDARLKDSMAALQTQFLSSESAMEQALARLASSADGIERSLKDLEASVQSSEEHLRETLARQSGPVEAIRQSLMDLEARVQSSEDFARGSLARQSSSGDGMEQSLHALEARVRTTEDFVRDTLASQMQNTEEALTAHASARAALEQAFVQLDERMTSSEGSLQEALDRQSRSGTRIEEAIGTLEAAMQSSETRVNESVQRHLDSIERNLGAIVSRLERTEHSFASRMDAAEKTSRAGLAGLQSQLGYAASRIETIAASRRAEISRDADLPVPSPGLGSGPMGPFAEEPMRNFDFGRILPAPLALELPALSPVYGLDGALPAPRGGVPGAEADTFLPAPAAVPPEARDYLTQARRAARAAEESARRDPQQIVTAQSSSLPMSGTVISKAPPKRKGFFGRFMISLIVILFLAAGYFLVRNLRSRSEVVALASNSDLVPISNYQANPPDGTSFEGSLAEIPPVEAPGNVQPEAATAPQQVARAAPPRAAPTAVIPPPAPLSPPPPPTKIQLLTLKAESGDAKAALVLGLAHADGEGVPVNDTEALRWLRMASEAGEAVAQYRLGTFYEKGRGTGASAATAAKWYQESAKLGNRKAMHNLAVAYADGTGLKQNFSEAVRWFKNAAELGLTDSQFNLAVLYERGLGVPASLGEAYKWYAIAMVSGDPEAKSRVDALSTQLPAQEKTAAERTIRTFKARAMDVATNDPPQVASVLPK